MKPSLELYSLAQSANFSLSAWSLQMWSSQRFLGVMKSSMPRTGLSGPLRFTRLSVSDVWSRVRHFILSTSVRQWRRGSWSWISVAEFRCSLGSWPWLRRVRYVSFRDVLERLGWRWKDTHASLSCISLSLCNFLGLLNVWTFERLNVWTLELVELLNSWTLEL